MKMKKIVCMAMIVMLNAPSDLLARESACVLPAAQQTTSTLAQTTNWEQLADGMVDALIEHYWGASFPGYPKRYYFNYGSDLSNMTTEHYWPQAHAMDVIIDAYMRTGKKKYKTLYPLWWQGAPRFNFAGRPEDAWWNVFVDDMEWMVLTQIRMYESTGKKKYLKKAAQMYDQWIWPTWGPEDEAPWYGGITWKTDVEKSKNACSNGPAALIAARLYRFMNEAGIKGKRGNEAYLQEAKKIFSWLRSTLFNETTGAVADHMDRRGQIKRDWLFTYNQGTFLGAAHELYRITGESHYLEDAVKAANFVTDHMTNNDGALSDATNGDGGLFHGIFFRYFVKLANEGSLDKSIRQKYHAYLTQLAQIMANEGLNHTTKLYGGNWHKAHAANQPVGLTPHVTGCMLMEAMCVLKPID